MCFLHNFFFNAVRRKRPILTTILDETEWSAPSPNLAFCLKRGHGVNVRGSGKGRWGVFLNLNLINKMQIDGCCARLRNSDIKELIAR